MPKPLLGHAHAQAQLSNMLESQRFPHALLLHGPRGIGKSLLAEHLAWRLICGKKPNETNMFGEGEGAPLAWNAETPHAAQLAAGTCPDLHRITLDEGKKSISIKQIKELLEVLQRSADTARVAIVDALEDLTPEASNTILKTLEEPRPGIYFLLVSHQLSAVLPTIRSRARLLPLHPLSISETVKIIEKNGGDPALASLAAGAPGSVLGQGAAAREKLLKLLRNNELPAPNTEALLPTLLHHLSTQPPSLQRAETYFSIKHLYEKQQEINLPLATVNEAALALYPQKAN